MSQIPPPETPPTVPYATPPSDPARAVAGPGLALLIYGSVLVVFSIISLLLNILGAGLTIAGGDKSGGMLNGAAGIAGAIFGLCFGGVILFGGMKMKKLQSYGLAMTGAIMAMLPCSVCCIVGLPLGIWALVVLMKPEVKAAFGGGVPPTGFPTA